MKKLTLAQLSFAEQLLKKHTEESQVFVKLSSPHMYFKKEAALLSVGGNLSDLLVVTRDGQVSEVIEETKSEAKEISLVPDENWKYADLVAHAEKLGIAIDKNVDKSKVSVLAKINAKSDTPGA